MARKIANNPLFDIETEREEIGITPDTTEVKKGRPRKDLVRDNAAQAGLPVEWTRATFICKTELLNKLKDYAYTERISLKEALDMALTQFLEDKNDLLQHK